MAQVDRALAEPSGRHGEIVAKLAVRILSGGYPADMVLPTAEELCLELDVSRTSLREALRVLEAKGLVEARQRIGTRVCPRERWLRLDPDVLRWARACPPDPEFMQGLLETRWMIEPMAAELAAKRATARDLMVIEAAFNGMASTLATDLEACTQADVEFHIAILRATHNPVIANLATVIGAALKSTFILSNSLSESFERTLRAHGEVLEGIRMRDPERAGAAMRSLLGIAREDLGPLADPDAAQATGR